MLVTKAVLDALRTTFSAKFREAYDGTEVWHNRLTTRVGSSSKSNTYGWKAMQTRLREWIGPRVAQNLSEHAQVVPNKLYEGTVEVPRTDIEDDELGIFTGMIIPDLAEATRKHPDALLADLLLANPTGFDGVTFFNSAHPNFNTKGGAATYSNDYDENLDMDGFAAVRAGMGSILGENGHPLRVNPNLLMVPPQLEKEALILQNSMTYPLGTPTGAAGGSGAAAVDNIYRNKFDVVVVPELAVVPTDWYLADVSRSMRPFVFQVRDDAEFVSRDNPEDPKVFELDLFTYGVRARWAVSTALPFLIARSTHTPE
jgi:phage major head subunit gpT-like protein